MIDAITPVILTRDEAPNIGRTLAALAWARDIVIVDSLSTDDTLAIAARHPNVRVFQRPFDNHAAQWNHAITQTGIATPWVLALDADYVATPAFVAELARCDLDGATAGYRCRFVYCVEGTPLRGALYPPVIALFRRVGARYVQDGHTQRLHIDGPVGAIASPLLHDDRKPLDRWIGAQARYARLEAAKLAATPWRELPFSGRVRRLIVVAPVLVPLHCLIVKGGILHGRAGVYYALQRGVAETLIALNLLARALRPGGPA